MYFLIKFAFSRSNLLYAGPALNNCREKEKEQIIRSSSASSVVGGGLDLQLVNRLLMASSWSASARNLREF